ncbi:AAA family ATPase [Prevotella melaninogenica]|uniref:AAA family ATPase n=1 Tax=Prevotella melaninogenica TaxID=28132 RepID=UPI001BA6586F|nr:AAA family ATPase [Prevotella melaninogenica]QUB68109.1 AAA family ATPase [Prevotella melaninogenica]QUB69153.1 AAA family ATPase [Prevotella melaninogenica]
MSFKKLDTNEFIKAAKEYNAFDGYKCGIKSIDDIMRIDKQTLTTLVATPAAGKSTFTNFYGYQMAKYNGWKTLYIAEETPQDRQCRMLSILFDSAAKASEFSVLYNYDLSDWNDLLMMIKDAKETYGVDMVILDNMTELKKLISGNDTETEKIGRALSDLKKASIVNDIAVILVAHPTKLLEGQEVTAYSVHGSANYYNISDFMFTLTADKKNCETTIKVLKVRDSAKGVMGEQCTLKYNPVRFTYSDTDSTEDSQPKQDISNNIATDVMKAIMEEETQEDSQPATPAVKEVTKQEDRQPATQPAGKASTTPTKQQGTPANTPSRDNTTKQPRTQQQQGQQQAAKGEAKEEKQHITPDFLTNTKVSIMKQHKVLNESNLYNAIITGRICKQEITKVRSIDRQANESEYRQAKAKVSSYTPSCVCASTTAKEVKEINPLIAIDLDAKDNEGVTLEEMRKRINSLPYVMYSSLSVGGRGMYALIPILDENKNDFKGVFKALESDFKALGLILDSSCVNVNRERYMSFDDNEYWNTKCEIYTKKINIPTQVHTHPSKVGENATKPLTQREFNKVKSMVEDIKRNKLQLSKSHNDTLKLCNAIANVWGENGRELIHIIRSQRSGYDEYKTDKNYTYVLDHLDDKERYGLGYIFKKYDRAKGQTQVN